VHLNKIRDALYFIDSSDTSFIKTFIFRCHFHEKERLWQAVGVKAADYCD